MTRKAVDKLIIIIIIRHDANARVYNAMLKKLGGVTKQLVRF